MLEDVPGYATRVQAYATTDRGQPIDRLFDIDLEWLAQQPMPHSVVAEQAFEQLLDVVGGNRDKLVEWGWRPHYEPDDPETDAADTNG